jgi:polyisoprenyl-phosphate glycosyltransferase
MRIKYDPANVAPDLPGRDRSSDTRPGEVAIMIPVFNDWASLAQLLPRLDRALASHFLTVDVLVIDDGSTIEPASGFKNLDFASLRRIDVLRLRRNLGHQRAIAVGLAYIEDSLDRGGRDHGRRR